MTLVKGGGAHSSERQFGSHSSSTDHAVTTFDADVDVYHIKFGEEEERKKEDALKSHDTDHISITPCASDDTLTEASSDLAAIHSTSCVAKDSESADGFILAREAVVRFVEDSIAKAVDRQK